MDALEIRNLRKEFSVNGERFEALKGVRPRLSIRAESLSSGGFFPFPRYGKAMFSSTVSHGKSRGS